MRDDPVDVKKKQKKAQAAAAYTADSDYSKTLTEGHAHPCIQALSSLFPFSGTSR